MPSRILFVDEDRDFALTLASRCRSMGLEAITTASIWEAVSWLEWNTADLICLDLDLSKDRGADFFDYLASRRETAEVPLIVMTGRKLPVPMCIDCHPQTHFLRKSIHVWQDFRTIVTRRLPVPARQLEEVGEDLSLPSIPE